MKVAEAETSHNATGLSKPLTRSLGLTSFILVYLSLHLVTLLLHLLHLTSHPSFVLPLMRFLHKLLSKSPDTICDLDSIPTSLMRQCAHILHPTTTSIINMYPFPGSFPDQFKNSSSSQKVLPG